MLCPFTLAHPEANEQLEGIFDLKPCSFNVDPDNATSPLRLQSLDLGPRMRDQMEGFERPEALVSLKVSLSHWIS
ncbi:hypothetical protein C0431_09285 [bacterium]|nr:hypothetical protein [bacterium]